MILVPNRRQPLSGNKRWFLIMFCSCLAACSPKTRTVYHPKKDEGKKQETAEVKTEKKITEANIALLVPFNLSAAKIKSGSKAEIEKSAMAIDFYQGFRMGIDSAAAGGMNFHLNVLDTRDDNSHISTLIRSGQLSASNLIVGPVFPEGMKAITGYAIANHIPIVSPLAATHPAEFNNPNLISIVNNIDLHAAKIGSYIARVYDPAQTVVVLISTRKSDDELLAVPLRAYFSTVNNKYTFQEFSSVFTMELNMVPGKKYLVLLSSTERQFVVATIDKLVKLKHSGVDIELFGHPNWPKQNYSTEKLQLLQTKVTSSYKVDYKNQAVIGFIRKYRSLNSFEPGEYAFKGFDIGFYFGKLLSEHGAGYLKYLTEERYRGLQNSMSFKKDNQLGYINTSLFLLQYKNYALIPLE